MLLSFFLDGSGGMGGTKRFFTSSAIHYQQIVIEGKKWQNEIQLNTEEKK